MNKSIKEIMRDLMVIIDSIKGVEIEYDGHKWWLVVSDYDFQVWRDASWCQHLEEMDLKTVIELLNKGLERVEALKQQRPEEW